MGFIRSCEGNFGRFYERVSDSGDVIDRVGIYGFIKEYEGTVFFIIYDHNGSLIDEANYYLNKILLDSNYKKREMAFTALKNLYAFIKINNLRNYKQGFEEVETNRLVSFLKGGQSKGISYDIDIEIVRKNTTVNNYLHVIRDFYVKFFRLKEGPLLTKQYNGKISGGGLLGHANKKVVEKFKINQRVANSAIIPPKYIKKEQL